MSLPRGLRNNNPGNIRITKDKWQGLREKQEDKSFFQFTEMKWGYRALIRTLQNYRKRHGCQTVADFVHRWAPENENNTAGYISRVCSEMQVPNTYYSMPELSYVAIKIYATVVSNHYNRRDLRPEGSVRQVFQENRVLN